MRIATAAKHQKPPMKLMPHDTPLHEGRPSEVIFTDEEEEKPRTLRDVAEQHGIHTESIGNFRRRHPELAHWSVDQVAAQVVLNKNQSAVAKRQQRRERGRRNTFGSIDYAERTKR